MKTQKIHGLVAAPFTPFQSDGSLNLPVIEKQAEFLVSRGVAGAFVCGTTGEGPSLTLSERQQVAERWIQIAGDSLCVIVHAGHASQADSIALAAHAQKAGAVGVSILAPYFFKPRAVSDLVDFCVPIAAAAPEIPFYYYHIPSITGGGLSMYDFLVEAAPRIPNLAGIKFTHEDLVEYSACLRFEDGRFDLLFGRDEILLPGLVLGAKGAVGSTYNYMPQIYRRLIEAFDKGDFAAARALQAQATDIIGVMIRHGGLPAGKAMMAMAGVDCGPVRAPLRKLDATQRAALQKDLESFEFPFT